MRIRHRAKQFGFKPSDVRPFALRLYAELSANHSNLKFQTNTVNQKLAMEILLEKSDAFWASEIGLAIHKVKIDANGNEFPANSHLIHYDDPNFFPGPAIAPGIATEQESLAMLYNALLSIKTDQDVRLENYDTRQLRTVPETQYNPNAPITMWQHDGSEMKDISTNLGFWGNKRNEITVDFKDGDYSAIEGVDADHKNYGVIILKGFLLVRGAEALTLSDAAKIFR